MNDQQLNVIRQEAAKAFASKNFRTEEVHVDSSRDGGFTFMGIPVRVRGDLAPGEAYLVTPGREPIPFDLP